MSPDTHRRRPAPVVAGAAAHGLTPHARSPTTPPPQDKREENSPVNTNVALLLLVLAVGIGGTAAAGPRWLAPPADAAAAGAASRSTSTADRAPGPATGCRDRPARLGRRGTTWEWPGPPAR
ncbi:hypothetical protein FXW78_54245 [Rhodococcus opacus]|nr:hypothetical protein [Rhodococcus opacus]